MSRAHNPYKTIKGGSNPPLAILASLKAEQVAVNHPDGGSNPPRGVFFGAVAEWFIAAVCKIVLYAHRFESYQPQKFI